MILFNILEYQDYCTDLETLMPVFYLRQYIAVHLTIIPRTRVGYELLDSGRGAKHRVGYHKLISNKREWNNCFIKYQTLDKNISNYIFYRLEFSAILWEHFLW